MSERGMTILSKRNLLGGQSTKCGILRAFDFGEA